MNSLRSLRQMGVALALASIVPALSGTTFAAEPAKVPLLWRSLASAPVQASSAEAIRSQRVGLNVEQLLGTRNQRFRLLLPDKKTLVLNKTREVRSDKRAFIWHGKVVGDALSSATFAVIGKTVVGDVVTSKGKAYRLRYDGKAKVHVVDLIDPSKYPPEKDPTPVEGHRDNPEADTCSTDPPDQIDVMVAYTTAARTGAGSVDAMEASIYLAVEETNQSYINSNINQRLRLVHMVEVSYTESGNSTTDKTRLKAKTDGFLDNLHTLRDTFAADAVVLITETLDACGESFIMTTVGNAFEDSAFAVIKRSCATGNYSFGHELGHVMSARHDWVADSTNNSPYAYNHGHTQPAPTTMGVSPWRTVMAYNNACATAGVSCTRLEYWSNPSVAVSGDATGTSSGQQEDNHAVLNNTALTVANFRCSSPGRNDVWMKDTWSDTGAEPDPNQATLPMWQSPYIWVRNQQDATLIHQHEHQNPELGQPNFIYSKVHNGGAATSGNLEIYIAKAATGLSWPADWTLVKSVPVGSFTAHSTRIVEAQWDPPATGHYCLIARWVSPSDPMTTPETTNIDANARGNNNIIWRNVNIVDLVKDTGDQASLIVRNTEKRMMTVNISVRPSGPASFLAFGRITIDLDDRLLEAWKRTGLRGKGFKLAGRSIVVVDSSGAVLQGLALNPGFEGELKAAFTRPKDGYPHDVFLIDIVQSEMIENRERTVGGVTYEVHTDRLER